MAETHSKQHTTRQYARDLNDKLKSFLELNPSQPRQGGETLECEVRFGTRGVKSITQSDFASVANRLLGAGFVTANKAGSDVLKVSTEFADPRTGRTRLSNVRTEIRSLAGIQAYCETNNLSNLSDKMVGFVQKQTAKDGGGQLLLPFDNDDFNFRVSIQTERVLTRRDVVVKDTLSSWNESKKNFRAMNRVSFTHVDYPVRVDLSISKTNNQEYGRSKLEYSLNAANVFGNPETYEIEIEVDNFRLGAGTAWTADNHMEFAAMMRVVIKLVLSGLQQTNYPISYPMQTDLLRHYIELVHGAPASDARVTPKSFVGPSSTTLQMKNIAEPNAASLIPNVRQDYTVTDKADGLRKLLFIADDGRLYLIDTNMRVQFTGALTKSDKLFKSIIDGEHIMHNRRGDFINLYAAFDVYFLGGRDVRANKFCPDSSDATKTSYRFPTLVEVMKHLKPESVDAQLQSPMRFVNKKFYQGTETQSIFVGCQTILRSAAEGGFDYDTDGLIFTPSYLGVGGTPERKTGPLVKSTWDYSFKWKPPEHNTIDFLVTTKKTTSGEDAVSNVFQEGTDTGSVQRLTQYKTLVLRCGFDERKHGYLNPCQNVIDDELPSVDRSKPSDSYSPMPFYPTNPYDTTANVCNMVVQRDGGGNLSLMTEQGEIFDDNTIVEFKYDPAKPVFWRWTPIRVRHDKTTELRQGFKNFGNAYHVANSNWHSIHNPITEAMLSSGEGIGDELADDDVYYNSTGARSESATRGLRDFHNLFVKKVLILSVAKPGDILIDMAVGKGGDWPKWIQSKLSFVFGLDISKDNIENRLDGACARFLNYRKQYKSVPYALFVQANSSVNIRSGAAAFTEKGKLVTNAVFGEGPRDAGILGPGVHRQYGKGRQGFNISSCQFAMHYFFESESTLHNFLRNLSECTAVGGYFIGTCYDGQKIFSLLSDKEVGQSAAIVKDGKKIWEVTREYSQTQFDATRASIGYAINVYQESINKTFREWLVNFGYLKQVMENYGFVLAPAEDVERFDLPSSSGSFADLFQVLETTVKQNRGVSREYGHALNMDTDEKTISFNNRYFVFKKMRDVDAQTLTARALEITQGEEQHLQELAASASRGLSEPAVRLDVKKKRGRPPVLKANAAAMAAALEETKPVPVPAEPVPDAATGDQPKKKRGRPPVLKASAEAMAAALGKQDD